MPFVPDNPVGSFKPDTPDEPPKPDALSTAVHHELGFETGNVNKGIAAGLGAPVDIAQDVLNLGKAAVGVPLAAMGRPDLAPIPREDAVGGSKWLESLMRQHGMITEDATPKTTREKLGAAVAQMGGNALGGTAGTVGAIRTAAKVENLVKRPPLEGVIKGDDQFMRTARELRKDGYVFPPSQVNPTLANRTAEGAAGAAKTAQEASIRNQDVSNGLAKKDLNVSANTPLNMETINNVRAEDYETYNKVRQIEGVFPLDTAYQRGVKSLNNEFASLETKFPGLTKSPEVEELKSMLLSPDALEKGLTPGEAIDLSRLLRKKATANFKATTMGGDPEKLAIAQAQRDAADIVENLISRNVTTKKPGLYEDWVDARKRLAISHDIESALNPDTGNINERTIGALSRKGRPLSGGLETIAKFANSFKKSAQPAELAGRGVPSSILDLMLSTMGAGAGGIHGGPEGAMAGAAAGAVARPALRSGLLSDSYQNWMVK